MKIKNNPRWISSMGCCQKIKHELLVYHYKDTLNKSYERNKEYIILDYKHVNIYIMANM